jgi:hypothetical protein
VPVTYREMKICIFKHSKPFSGSRKTVRSIAVFNFLVFALFVIPPAHRWVDRGFLALRSIHLEEPIGYSLEIWLVGSTLAATALLARMIWQARRTTSAGLPSVSLRLEEITSCRLVACCTRCLCLRLYPRHGRLNIRKQRACLCSSDTSPAPNVYQQRGQLANNMTNS